MSQEKINLLLNKIQTIIGPSGAISDLEKDLIKGYMRELYVLVDSLSSVDTGTTISSTPMPILEAPKAVDESMPRERLHQANEPTFAFEEHQDDFDDKAYKEDPSHPQVPKLEKDNGSTHSKPEMAPREVVSDDSLSEVIATKDVTPTDYQELFALEHAKDLSQKLSR
ncbi:MAG: hypothetical protein OEQ53_20835, partial [Saprospiraceae bacterium]|nr:hypothetical protein [Saprospiraceae bacterium]